MCLARVFQEVSGTLTSLQEDVSTGLGVPMMRKPMAPRQRGPRDKGRQTLQWLS